MVFEISELLKRFSVFKRDSATKKISKIFNESGLNIKPEAIIIKGDQVFVDAPVVLKNEVLIKREKFIKIFQQDKDLFFLKKII
jgi:hypothetical protein